LASSLTPATIEAGNRDDKGSGTTSKHELYSSEVSKQILNIVCGISDQYKRRCNLMVHNLQKSSTQEKISADTKRLKNKLSVTNLQSIEAL